MYVCGKLTFKIPENLKEMIRRLWSEGDTRREIAKSCGVSEGTVYNVVEEWKQLIGQRDAEAIRELSTSTKRNGIDIGQRAQGFRIHVLLRKTIWNLFSVLSLKNVEKLPIYLAIISISWTWLSSQKLLLLA